MKALLTIAIPTYNRASYLGSQLERLCAQNNERVAVLVSDNGSTDNTTEVVQTYRGRMSNLFYIRNHDNIGFDRNLLKLYEACSSEYIWFLSDDDVVHADAVARVLVFLSEYKPTVVTFGCRAEKGAEANAKVPVKVIESLESVTDYSLFHRLIFFSALVVRKDQALIIDELLPLTGTNFFQISLSLALLSRRFRFCLAPEVEIVTREVGYVTRTEIVRLWFLGLAQAMCLPQYGYDPEKVRASIFKAWKPFIRFLFSAKIGMYKINPGLSFETAKQIRQILGMRMLVVLSLCLGVYRVIPVFLLKIYYWFRCIRSYGVVQGVKYFRRKTSQALSPKASGF